MEDATQRRTRLTDGVDAIGLHIKFSRNHPLWPWLSEIVDGLKSRVCSYHESQGEGVCVASELGVVKYHQLPSSTWFLDDLELHGWACIADECYKSNIWIKQDDIWYHKTLKEGISKCRTDLGNLGGGIYTIGNEKWIPFGGLPVEQYGRHKRTRGGMVWCTTCSKSWWRNLLCSCSI